MPEKLKDALASLHVVVIGDVMLDRYHWGSVERISPEAPVPVVKIEKTEVRLGGAANVALNCRAFGAQVSIASVVGKDQDAEELILLLEENKVDHSLVLFSENRNTTSKTRILSRNQQMLRFDFEQEEDLNTRDEHAFIDLVLRYLQIQKPDVVIFEDYNKGVLKENVIQKIVRHCQNLGILMAVDPKKKNFLSYRGVDIFKPNLKEICEGLNKEITINLNSLEEAHKLLKERLDHQITFITLSEHGVYFQQGDEGKIVPSHHRNISDVSGAGDSVIAVAAMVYAVTKDASLMAEYSNIAGGLVCEEVGVAPVSEEKFWKEVARIQEQKTNEALS